MAARNSACVLRGTGLEDAIHVADQIRLAVEGRKLVKKSTGDVLGTITISIGVAAVAPTKTPKWRCAAPTPAFTAPSRMAAIW